MKQATFLLILFAFILAIGSATPQQPGTPALTPHSTPDSRPLNPRPVDPRPPDPRQLDVKEGYVGDAACLPCHRGEALSYAHTAHRLTSQVANRQSVLGSFKPGGTVLTISNPAIHPNEPALFFRMDAKDGGFYQTAITGWGDQLLSITEPIDVVTGSGARGQTYLYWQGNRLFELPVSYWTEGHRWVNSPGFVDGAVDLSRPINPGCLECHATYIRPLSADPLANSYDRQSLVTGISCETCHGPGSAHLAVYANQSSKQAAPTQTAILNPAKFSRDLQVDACAYCHSGIQRQAIAPAFSFVPGHALAEYFKPLQTEAASRLDEHPDVHGNQVGLLKRSRCYQSSPTMSCSTCHNTHAPEKPAAAYSSACLECHQWTSCGESRKLGHAIAGNCIDCHMPVEPTNVIASETAGQVVRAKMRNHWIKIYPGSQAP